MVNLIHLYAIFLCVGFHEGKRCLSDIQVPTGYDLCGSPNCYCNGNKANCFNIGDENIKIPDHITNLYINCSEIRLFTKNTLPYNVNLKYLQIMNTGISRMDKDAFSNQVFIRTLEVISCVFDIDRNIIFKAISVLKQLRQIEMTDLDISNTSLLHFSHINVSKVTDLSFKDNRLLEFNATFFSNFTSLRSLNLRNNRINDMTHMATFPYLQNIFLQNNQLEIHALHFCKNGTNWFPSLQTLGLASNNIVDFPALELSCLEKLKELDLAGNSFKEFNVNNISRFKNLQYISLSDNLLETIIPGHFPPALQKLDFGYNGFSRPFPPKLCKDNSTEQFPNITDISFRECSILKLWIDNWALCLPNLRVLDFGFNVMFVGSDYSVSRFRNLEILNLDGNRFRYINEHLFNSSSLKQLSLKYNLIGLDKIENRKLFKNSPSITHLDISGNSLGFLSDGNLVEIFSPLQQLIHLNIRSCKLSKIPTGILRNLTKLTSIDLNGNILTDVEFPKDLTIKLTSLSLAGNGIKSITERTFPRQLRKSLATLNLQWNDFHCGCGLKWFRDQINPGGKFGKIHLEYWPYGYYCRDETYSGKLLLDFSMSINQCPPLWYILSIALGCSGFVISVLVFFLYWKWWYVQIKWRDFKGLFSGNDETEIEHRYSGYVINHDSDRDFVNNEFRHRMEDTLGYKLHIWDRDSCAGKFKVDVMLDAIDTSKAVFVIVSNNLSTSNWGIFQVNVAISRKIEDNRRNIFFVLLEDINRKNLSKYWCVMLTKMPGVPWSNEADSIKSKLFDQEVKTILGPPPVSIGDNQQPNATINRIREIIDDDSITQEWREDNCEGARNWTDISETEPLLGLSQGSIKEGEPYGSIDTNRQQLVLTTEDKDSHKSENGEPAVTETNAYVRAHPNKTEQIQFLKNDNTDCLEGYEYAYTNCIVNETMSERGIAKEPTTQTVGDAMNQYLTMESPDVANKDSSVTDPDIVTVPD